MKMACQEEEWEQIFIGKWDFWNLKIPMRKYERIGVIWKPDFEKNACKMGLGAMVRKK